MHVVVTTSNLCGVTRTGYKELMPKSDSTLVEYMDTAITVLEVVIVLFIRYRFKVWRVDDTIFIHPKSFAVSLILSRAPLLPSYY